MQHWQGRLEGQAAPGQAQPLTSVRVVAVDGVQLAGALLALLHPWWHRGSRRQSGETRQAKHHPRQASQRAGWPAWCTECMPAPALPAPAPTATAADAPTAAPAAPQPPPTHLELGQRGVSVVDGLVRELTHVRPQVLLPAAAWVARSRGTRKSAGQRLRAMRVGGIAGWGALPTLLLLWKVARCWCNRRSCEPPTTAVEGAGEIRIRARQASPSKHDCFLPCMHAHA